FRYFDARQSEGAGFRDIKKLMSEVRAAHDVERSILKAEHIHPTLVGGEGDESQEALDPCKAFPKICESQPPVGFRRFSWSGCDACTS
ncbi:hypothetical protein K0M31_015641, partial [Melipona bicolor]